MTFTDYSSVEVFIAYWVGTGLCLAFVLFILGTFSNSWRGFGVRVTK